VHYDTEAIVRSLDVPLWVAHGSEDRIVPITMGRRVFAAAKVKGELLIVPGADHNDLVDTAGEPYWTWLTRALTAGGR
jgi:pimeloyl-ACP methyl ester carboxylesterase